MNKQRRECERPVQFYVILLFICFSAGFMLTGKSQAQVIETCPSDISSYWMLDENTGTSFEDSVGGHNAACVGLACPGFTNGRIGNALLLDGIDDALTVPPDESFNWGVADSFSIEFWMKTDSSSECSGNQVIIGRDDSSTDLHWWTGCKEGGQAEFCLYDKNDTSACATGSKDLTDGGWHHVVAVRDAVAAEIRIYVDGSQENSVPVIYTAGFDSAAADLDIGWISIDDVSGAYFSGSVDELALHNDVMTEKVIRQHYYDGSVGLRLGYCGCNPTIGIMPLGDSTTKGSSATPSDNDYQVSYRQDLNLDLLNRGYHIDFVGSLNSGALAVPSFDADHEGHGGWQAKGGPEGGIVAHIFDWLWAVDNIGTPANVVLLHIGTNDITAGDTAVENDVSEILDAIDNYSQDVTVVLAQIINRTLPQEAIQATAQFNADLRAMALSRIANGDRIILVDQESALNYIDDMMDDVHPNTLGYAKMADVWLAALENFLPVCVALAPEITSQAVSEAYAGLSYTYQIDAIGNPPPVFSLLSAPQGMTINPATGLIMWSPSSEGNVNVSVQASNSLGTDTQDFVLQVSATPLCPSGMTHFWKFDEISGGRYVDFYGYSDATCTDCPLSVTGAIEGAQYFDDTSKANVIDDNTFDFGVNDSFSIEFWMKTPSSSTCDGNQVVIGRDDSSTKLHWWAGCKTGGQAEFCLYDIKGNSACISGTTDLTEGQWHHVVAVRDSGTSEIAVYVDGVKEGAKVKTYAYDFASKVALNIGWLYIDGEDTSHFEGVIDELALYNRALSATEVLQHYSAGLSEVGYCSPLSPSIVSIPVTNAEVDAAYSYAVVAIGNPAPSFSLITSPSGMTIDSTTGLISWTPTAEQAGDKNVKVRASNGSGTDSQSFSITVAELPDFDSDGVPDAVDNCFSEANPDQADMDGDGMGDACDPDSDGDGVMNVVDTCPSVKPLKIIGTSTFFDSLQSALAYASLTNGNVIGCHDADFTEAVNFNQAKTITLRGGYDCEYSNVNSDVRIQGSLTVSAGTVTVENIVIQ